MSAPIKDMKRQFKREEIQIASKYGICSDLLAIRETQIETSFVFSFPFKLTKVRRIKWPVLKFGDTRAPPSTVGRVYVDTTLLGDSYLYELRTSKIFMLFVFIILLYNQTCTKIYACDYSHCGAI